MTLNLPPNLDLGLTILDLFCGAGGLSLGFTKAGFKVISAIDNNRDALETYAQNLGNHINDVDLSHPNELNFPATTVICGGPPCQGFSSAGLRRKGDQRNSLVSSFAQIVAKHKPQAFVFENVEGFLTAESGQRVMELLTPLIATGYRIHVRKINAANYGIPQHRKRVMVIGGLGWNPSFPPFTHSASGAPGSTTTAPNLTSTLTLSEALNDLPAPSIEFPGEPQGHFYRPLKDIDLERAMALQPGQTMRDLPTMLQHHSYQRRASRRVMDGTPSEHRGGAPTGIRRLRPDEPSKAITGGALSEFLHPTEHRPLTIRECARLQTFPDEFVFCGSVSSQIQLIANAVPPQLGEMIALSLAQDLESEKEVFSQGALLSFIPTHSSGFSPILKQVTHKIINTFGIGFTESQSSFLWD